jgi:hypothetical protein
MQVVVVKDIRVAVVAALAVLVATVYMTEIQVLVVSV